MTVFELARLPRTELIARYLAACYPTREDYCGVPPHVAAMSREQLTARIWEATHTT